MTIREALISMGYRECKPGKWLKPIGYQLFTYHEGKGEWANWFMSAQGQISCWETKRFSEDKDFPHVDQLKYFECWTRTNIQINGDSKFHLEAIDLG